MQPNHLQVWQMLMKSPWYFVFVLYPHNNGGNFSQQSVWVVKTKNEGGSIPSRFLAFVSVGGCGLLLQFFHSCILCVHHTPFFVVAHAIFLLLFRCELILCISSLAL